MERVFESDAKAVAQIYILRQDLLVVLGEVIPLKGKAE